MNTIRVLLLEDNQILLEGIVSLIKKYDDMRVVATLGANEDIPQRIGSYKPDVILLDLGLPKQNSLEIVKTTKRDFPATKVIVLDLIPTQEDVLEFVAAGVSGFILKDATIDDLLGTIRSVARGAKVLPSLLTNSLFSQIVEHAINGSGRTPAKLMESIRLTRRERQVIVLISAGMTNKEIGQKLHMSQYTVKSHVHNILEKLTLHTRVQIANFAHMSKGIQDIANTITLMNA